MNLFLVRHTEAIDYETESVRNDEYRFITPKGRKIACGVFKSLKEEFSEIDKIFTSPYIRAVQTAEILASATKYKNDIEVANELLPSGSAGMLQQLLKRNSIFNSVVLVGHEPMMSMLVEVFTNKKRFELSFKKAGVCFIKYDLETGQGILEWFFNPSLMAKKK